MLFKYVKKYLFEQLDHPQRNLIVKVCIGKIIITSVWTKKNFRRLCTTQFEDMSKSEILPPPLGYYDKMQNLDFRPTHQTGGA